MLNGKMAMALRPQQTWYGARHGFISLNVRFLLLQFLYYHYYYIGKQQIGKTGMGSCVSPVVPNQAS
jgi:hypothetical protein